MMRLFGKYADANDCQEYLTLKFSPQQFSIKDRWRNNGLSADFLADYWTTFFPAKDPSSLRKQTHIKSALSYIANELLENTMKFHCEDSPNPISITLYLFQEKLLFYVTNCAEPDVAERFETYIETLLAALEAGQLEQLYLSTLEANAKDDTHSRSGMGYLTMMHDYEAELSWRFETSSEHPDRQKITTMVLLPI